MSDEVVNDIRDAAWSRAKRITWLMAPAPAIYVFVGVMLMRRGGVSSAPLISDDLHDPVFYALVGFGALCIIIASVLRTVLRRAEPPASLSAAAQRFVQTHVLALGLAEFPAILGFAYFLMTGDLRRMIALSAACVLVLTFFLPSRAALESYVRRRGPTGGVPT